MATAWVPVPAQYTHGIYETSQGVAGEASVQTFYFSRGELLADSGISNAGINDNNLRALPDGSTDCFATFHKTSASDRDQGVIIALFVDSHVEEVYPGQDDRRRAIVAVGWPGKKPAPVF